MARKSCKLGFEGYCHCNTSLIDLPWLAQSLSVLSIA